LTSSKFQIKFSERARKQFKKLDVQTRNRIALAIKLLAINPFPPKAKRVVGFDYWRIRIGDYRVVYEIIDQELVILVVRIGHRKNVYDQLKNLKSKES
jgi:mRNA interferase RelE/StbE